MNLRFLLFLSFILFASPYGCSSTNSIDLPDLGLSNDELNRDLVIEIMPECTVFRMQEQLCVLCFSARLKSELEIRGPRNLNVRLFVFLPEESKWQEIQEIPNLGVHEEPNIVLSKKEGNFDEVSFQVLPKIPKDSIQKHDGSVKLLVVITGDIYKDGQKTDKRAGAYMIVNLKP